MRHLRIEHDDLTREPVHRLLGDHLADMVATSPQESVHALDLAGLRQPDLTFWTAWTDSLLLGCAALKELSSAHGEIKSMRTATTARGRGVATRLLDHLVTTALQRGYRRLSLETGSDAFFAPARRLYARAGFVACPPFGDYRPDPHSVFMSRSL